MVLVSQREQGQHGSAFGQRALNAARGTQGRKDEVGRIASHDHFPQHRFLLGAELDQFRPRPGRACALACRGLQVGGGDLIAQRARLVGEGPVGRILGEEVLTLSQGAAVERGLWSFENPAEGE